MFTKDDLVFLTQEDREKPNYLIIGSSFNGPVQTVFQLNENVDPYDVLGACKMAYGVTRARDHGVNPLLFRLNGAHGEVSILHEEGRIPCLAFRSVEATTECNDIYFHCYPTHMIIRGLYQERVLLFSDYNTIGELADSINLLMWYEGFEIEATALAPELSPSTMIQAEKTYYMEGADDGFHFVVQSKDEYATVEEIDGIMPITNKDYALELLQSTFITENGMNTELDILGYAIDTISYSDIPYESAPNELLSIFGQFSSELTDFNGSFVATVLSTVEPHPDFHPKQNPFNLSTDWLRHILIVDGEEVSTVFQESTMPISLNYAPLRFATEGTTSNVPLPSNTVLVQERSKVKVAELVGKGYICVTGTRKGVVVPFLEQNIHPSSSYLSKSYLLRSAYQDISSFADLLSPHIGEIFNSSKNQFLQTAMNDLCQELKKKIYYRDVTFTCVHVEDRLDVTIQIVFCGEVGSLTVKTSYTS